MLQLPPPPPNKKCDLRVSAEKKRENPSNVYCVVAPEPSHMCLSSVVPVEAVSYQLSLRNHFGHQT